MSLTLVKDSTVEIGSFKYQLLTQTRNTGISHMAKPLPFSGDFIQWGPNKFLESKDNR